MWLQQGGKQADDAPYFIINKEAPFPNPAHSKSTEWLPLVSDAFLLQKKQAFGYFKTTKDMSSVCKEHFLRRSGVKMPVFMRFFTATFGREFPDSGRNSRGMAIKFYTGEGNYDIVGLQPVFCCWGLIQGLDVIRSQSWNSQNFLLDYNPVFDLLANTLEGSSLEMKLSCMSDVDPDYLECDLWSTIEKGEQISWAAHVQKMNPEEADPAKLWFTPFGVTKVWPRKRFPMHEFGKLVLNKKSRKLP
ncbi:catalase [Blastomyces gilchristii SLH14081]|uniref:Catalase n=1 Tax=Blastomyces gilchristii (strain SLH14081) TaxID=559298 RepID=A0A179UWR3_BLAGS|nr:catalase [Blastomyces gilchristii SLH14081]OAT12536.1 catalase [Blastomyces gilchristii SLH14081]